VSTTEPRSSSPSVIGGRLVTVMLLISERLTALAKSSALKLMPQSLVPDIAILPLSHNTSIPQDIGISVAPASFAARTKVDTVNIRNAKHKKNKIPFLIFI
jgi:hypothetical protein